MNIPFSYLDGLVQFVFSTSRTLKEILSNIIVSKEIFLKKNLLKKNLLGKNLLKKNLLKRNLPKRHLLKRNVLKINLLERKSSAKIIFSKEISLNEIWYL